MLRPLAFAALFSLILVADHDAHATESRHVHWIGKVASGRTLVIDEPDGPHTLLALPAWATIDATVVSPSGAHALVYAQVRAGETRTVFVLDLASHAVEGSYKPGFGGQFFFTANDRVLQYWGCGTQCAEMQVRTRDGTSLSRATCAGFDEDDELSSDRRIALCFGDDAAVTVLDVDRGKTLAREPLPCAPGHRDAVKIDAKAGKARFTCDDEQEKRFAVTVSFGATRSVSSRALP